MATTIYLIRPETYPIATSYLLDTYSAAAAYSLRQLKTGVTSVVRVRRSSDNAEGDFTATEITDGTLTTWTGANDGFVATWYDQSGNGYNVTQSTAGNQPKLVSSGSVLTLNSVSAIQFDGSNDYLTRGTALSELHANDISWSYVANNEANNANGLVFSNRQPSGSNIGWLGAVDRRTNKVHTLGDVGASNTIYTYLATDNTNSQRLQSFFLDSSNNGEAFLNGASQSTATLGASITTGGNFDLGRQALGAAYLNGYIQEWILWNSDESANRTAIESDINGHYSIYP